MRDTDSILCSPGDSLGGRGPVTKFSHPYRFSRRSDRQDPYSLLRPQSQVKHGYGFAIPSVHTTLTVTETRIHFHADFCAESTPTVQPSLTHRMPRVQTTTNPPTAPIPTRIDTPFRSLRLPVVTGTSWSEGAHPPVIWTQPTEGPIGLAI